MKASILVQRRKWTERHDDYSFTSAVGDKVICQKGRAEIWSLMREMEVLNSCRVKW